MTFSFFEQPIVNSLDEHPAPYWETDKSGRPTNLIMPVRR
jgi:hypothetical protein